MGRGKRSKNINPIDGPKLRQAKIRIERLPEDENTEDDLDDYGWQGDGTRRLVYFGPTDDETMVETFITVDKDTVTDWIDEIRSLARRRQLISPLVAGVEIYTGKYDSWWASYFYPDRELPTTAAISICVGGAHCLVFVVEHDAVFDPFVSRSLRDFFADPKMSFVGFGIKEAAETMKKEWGLEIKNPIEARTLGKMVMGKENPVFWWERKGKVTGVIMEKASREQVFAMATGIKLDEKPSDVSHFNWGHDCDVDGNIVMHATVDALVSFKIGQIWLKKLGRPI